MSAIGVQFTQFNGPVTPQAGDIIVGVRNGLNYQFNYQSGGSTSSNSLITVITQTAHGFTAGQIVYFNGAQYALAKADTAADAEVVGIVASVIDANDFNLLTGGYVTALSALVPGSVYFLSDSTAGALSTTEPSTAGHISKPLLIATSNTTAFFFNWRGKVVPSANPAVTSITGTANEITASASTGAVTLSIPSTFIAPGTLAAVTSASAPTYLITGASSGTISVLPQTNSGTYNFNMPTTAGTSGYLLTSAGGGGSAMTWTNPASIGGVTSIAGTSNEITASAATGAVTLSVPSTFIAPGTLAAVTSISSPEYLLTGSGSGTISILPQSSAGTYNFNLPTTAGTSGYLLTSAGGSGSPMTWTNPASIGGVTSIAGTTHQITASASTGAITLSVPSTFIAPGTAAAVTSMSAPEYLVTGASSGTISILPQAAAGTYNLNLPTTAGTSGYFLTSDGGGSGGGMTWTAPSTPNAVIQTITQVAHGFSVGNVVYYNGSAYALAEANSTTTAEALGVVSNVASSSVFSITLSGYIPSGLSGFTAGDTYWLSDATAGLLQLTQPTTVGNVQKPMFVADSSSSGYVINYRGEVIPTSFSLPVSVANGGTGATTLTGLLTGSGTSAITGTAITQYYVLTGGASNVPNSVSPGSTSGVPLISQGASSQPIFGTVVVAGGGTGLTTTTAYGLIAGGTSSTGNFQNAGTGTSGQVYVSGGSSSLGTWSTLSGFTTFSAVSTNTNMAVNTFYYLSGGTSLTMTLPSTAAAGTVIAVAGGGESTSWTIAQNSGQSIVYAGTASTTGTGGSLASTAAQDKVTLICVVANTTWIDMPGASDGFLTVT